MRFELYHLLPCDLRFCRVVLEPEALAEPRRKQSILLEVFLLKPRWNEPLALAALVN